MKKPSIVWTDLPQNMEFRPFKMCNMCSTVVGKDSREAHQTFHDTYIHRSEVRTMSGVAWCDPGGHAFKAGEPGSQSFQGTTRDENGDPIRIDMDACKEHSFQPTKQEGPAAINPSGDSHS